MRLCVLTAVVCLATFAATVNADEIYFKNGDRLTGKIESMVDGKLVLKSDIAGKVTIDMTDIVTFSTAEPVEVHLGDGKVLNEKVVKGEPQTYSIAPNDQLQEQALKMAGIVSINPPPKPVPKWTGDVSAGLTVTRGNTKTQAVSGSINLKKRTEKDRTHVSFDYAKGERENSTTKKTETIQDWWRFGGKYDYFFRPKVFAYVDGRYEKDSVANLDRRIILGGGGGYQWVESPQINFNTRGGLASRYEKYQDATGSNNELTAQLGYDFDYKLSETVKFINVLTYYPSTEQVSDYFLTSTAEMRADITKSIFTNFRVIFNYDSTPAIRKGSTDVKYLWGVGVSF